MKKYLKQTFTSLFGNTVASTTVEFMFAMPLIVFWFAGSYTFFDAFSEYNRAIKATYTVGDILSRQTEIDDDYIDDMNMLFASFMSESTNDTWVRISSIQQSGDDYVVDWSTATGLHNPLSVSSDIPSEIIPNMVDEETVILIETFTPFLPFLDYIGLTEKTYGNQIVVSPRFTSKLANTDS